VEQPLPIPNREVKRTCGENSVWSIPFAKIAHRQHNALQILSSFITKLMKKDLLELMKKHSKEVKTFEQGEVVEGTIVGVDKKYILLDIGAKQEGLLFKDEIKNIPDFKIEMGKTITALVLYPEDVKGNLVLSLKKAKSQHSWDSLQEAYNNSELINATVIDYLKGGLFVDVLGQKGFIPISHLNRHHFEQFNNAMMQGGESDAAQTLGGLKGTELQVKIIEIDAIKNRLVMSEKEAMPDNELVQKDKRLGEIQKGDVIKGKVTIILPYGVLVDLNGVDGLIHISEIAWEKVESAKDYFQAGEEVEVKVIGKDGDKIALSVKELKDNPWNTVEEKYPLGTKIKSKVTKVVPFGAFIELEKGLDGLIHVSEMVKPLNVGDEVEAVVVNVDSKDRKLALSVRKIEDTKIYR